MGTLSLFLKENKKVKENKTFAATKSLCDDKGKALLWTIKPLTTRENDDIRDACTYDAPVKGKPGMSVPKLNTSKYLAKMICKSVVEPNLNSKELQDSYGVKTPEDLVLEMIDDPGEYNEFAAFIQEYNSFTDTMQDKVDEAKN